MCFRSRQMNAKSSDSGIVAATMSPARSRRGRRSRTTTTSTIPRSRLSSTVRVVSAIEVAAVVERADLHVLRQDRVVQLPRLRLDALEHRLRLLALAQQDHALDGVVPSLKPNWPRRGACPIDDLRRRPSRARACRCAPRARRCRCPPASPAARGRARSRTGRPRSRIRRRRCRCSRRARSTTSRAPRGPRRRASPGRAAPDTASSRRRGPTSSATPGTDLYCRSSTQSSIVLSSIGERSGLSST